MQKNAYQQQMLEKRCFKEKTLKYRGKLLSFYSCTYEEANGSLRVYDMLEHPGASVMIPINDRGEIHFIQQWRRCPGKILLELPAGVLEPNESPKDCAQRELQEEIGFMANQLTYLGGFFTAPGFCNEYLHLFLAENLTFSPAQAEDTPYIDRCVLSLEKTLEALDQGLIEDAKTLCGILKYLRHINKLPF